MKKIRIGSRESVLAVAQANIVIEAIHQYDPEIEIELVTMKTTGDKILDRTLDKIGGKGLFVKELDVALMDGRVDLTVHSSKDLPMSIDPRIPLVAFSKRANPRDVLVLPEGKNEIDFAKPIGCSSLRRRFQLHDIFPDAILAPIRGNVLTRLQKLDAGEFSALVLAEAGLQRLHLEQRITRAFSTEEILPAAGQAILAVQARAGVDTSFLSDFADPDSRDCLMAERAFVRTLDGGCSAPVAAYAFVSEDTITLKGMYVADNQKLYFETISGCRKQGEVLGITLAKEMRRKYQ